MTQRGDAGSGGAAGRWLTPASAQLLGLLSPAELARLRSSGTVRRVEPGTLVAASTGADAVRRDGAAGRGGPARGPGRRPAAAGRPAATATVVTGRRARRRARRHPEDGTLHEPYGPADLEPAAGGDAAVPGRGDRAAGVPVAVVVGSVLTAVDQGGVLLGRHAGVTTGARVVATDAIPFCVSSWGALSAVRLLGTAQPQERRDRADQ